MGRFSPRGCETGRIGKPDRVQALKMCLKIGGGGHIRHISASRIHFLCVCMCIKAKRLLLLDFSPIATHTELKEIAPLVTFEFPKLSQVTFMMLIRRNSLCKIFTILRKVNMKSRTAHASRVLYNGRHRDLVLVQSRPSACMTRVLQEDRNRSHGFFRSQGLGLCESKPKYTGKSIKHRLPEYFHFLDLSAASCGQ